MLRLSLFMAGVMMAFSGHAGNASPCPADTVPIQITNEVEYEPVTTLSAAGISKSKPQFRDFVTSVTEHVATRLAKDKHRIDSASSKEQSLLQFVHWPLVISDPNIRPFPPAPSLEARPAGGCRITSPWIDIAYERKPVPWIRAVVRWNQRQLLADQAVLDGARNVPPGVAMPLKRREFIRFAEGEYAKSEIGGRPAAAPIEARVPPDLLWLFRRSWQSTRGPFSSGARGAMTNAMKAGAERQTQLVIALIDRCFVSDGAEIHYNSILDIKDLISLEQYKITTRIAD